jgi:hypothetical protein
MKYTPNGLFDDFMHPKSSRILSRISSRIVKGVYGEDL